MNNPDIKKPSYPTFSEYQAKQLIKIAAVVGIGVSAAAISLDIDAGEKKATESIVADKGKKVKEYSLGMKQRLGLARAIVTKPELLILDEPINGLDPVGIQEVRSLLLKLSKEYGVTIFISSHIISEIEQIADTIAVINKGRIIKEVTSEKAKEESTAYTSVVIDDVKKAVYIIDSQLGIKNLKVISDKEIHIYDTGVVQGVLNRTLVMNDVTVESITKKEGTLEDYFLSLIEVGDLGV